MKGEMVQLNQTYHTLFRQALKDPTKLSEEDILALLVRYPYSQPLVFAYERRKVLLGESSPDKNLALLYASSTNWLWSFVNKPLPQLELLVPVSEDYIPFEELEHKEVEARVEKPETQEEDTEVDALERLMQQGGITGDYFLFQEKNIDPVIESSATKDLQLNQDEESSDEENISLYNDDLMPYSFRWWLYKTRLEHADTYQPFAVAQFPIAEKSFVDFKKVDEAILDQQIKESIIHFQDPEMKLSDEMRNKPINTELPKKLDEVIEKFIREEPMIQAPSADVLHNENMARQSSEDKYELVTETLANIYIDQALYLKAIEVFKKLILKYPEKKSYFATRIQEIEKNL